MFNLSGIYILEYKWTLYWLFDNKNNTKEVISKEKLLYFLAPLFTIDKINRVFEELYNEKRILVDFDNKKLKLIVEKETPFLQAMLPYFNAKQIEKESLEYQFEELF